MQPTPDSITFQLIAWSAIAAIPISLSVRYARILSLYGVFLLAIITIGLLSGTRTSTDNIQLVRDLISFLFWVLGPLLIALTISHPRSGKPILTLEQTRLVLALAGAALSVRYLIQQGADLEAALVTNLRVNLEYLSSEPLVTFAFIYAAMATFRAQSFYKAAGFAVLFAMASVGLVAVTYRGPLLLGFTMFISAGTVYAFVNAKSSPLRVFTVLIGAIVAIFLLQDELGAIAAKIMTKFESVGTNSKISEFLGVFAINSSFGQMMLGNGFGGRGFIEGAGTTTGYTHNVISYAYLKTGYVGTVLVIAAMAAALLRISLKRRLAWHYMPEILTILYIGMFQGAYKHLGYGLLLGVCLAAGYQARHRAYLSHDIGANTVSRNRHA
jgi:hypothetical protein